MPPKKQSADSEVATRQSSRKRKVPDRYEEYVSGRAVPDSPEPRSRSNSPASRSKSKSKKKQESESEDEVPSDFSDEDEPEEESEEEGSEEENASESEDDKKKKKKNSRGRSASKSDKSKKSSNGNKSKGSSKSFLSKLDENVRDELEGYNVDELKERLRDNDQVSTGTKGELQERIAECIVDGCFPRCPKCGLGKVKKDAKGYFCPGGYDDDKYKRCSWKSKNVDRPQWKVAKGNLV
mmetsp:Transcript_10259/g.14072  ORF Transcript_10259/g.14072 Transcript_10259/m.14072 type:complete len:238 (-) Transcript_10259:332-1045(-)